MIFPSLKRKVRVRRDREDSGFKRKKKLKGCNLKKKAFKDEIMEEREEGDEEGSKIFDRKGGEKDTESFEVTQ